MAKLESVYVRIEQDAKLDFVKKCKENGDGNYTTVARKLLKLYTLGLIKIGDEKIEGEKD